MASVQSESFEICQRRIMGSETRLQTRPTARLPARPTDRPTDHSPDMSDLLTKHSDTTPLARSAVVLCRER